MSNLNQILAQTLYSGDPLEQDAIYEGQSAYGDLPLCLYLLTFFLHGAIRGRTNAGKTLEVMRQIFKLCLLQSPARLDHLRSRGRKFEEYSIVHFDQKDDNASFNSSHIAASFGDMKFRALDPRIGATSNVYNPFKQKYHKFMSTVQRLEEILSALGLIHSAGSGYGPWFFTVENGRRLAPPFEANRDEDEGEDKDDDKKSLVLDSFRTLSRVLDNDKEFLGLHGATKEMLKNGSHAAGLAWFLSKIHPLNVTGRSHPRPRWDDLHENAIDALSLFHEKQFVHVTVPWGDFPMTGTSIVNLLLMQIFNAGRYAKQTRKYRVIIYIDEAQHALTEQMVKQFAQARSYGITLVLVHQQRDQLADIGGKDLRSQVDGNIGWSIDLDASGEEMIGWIQKNSPTAMRVHRSYVRPVSTINSLADPDEYGMPRALETAENISFVEREGPLYSQGEIMALNSTGRVGWLRVPLDNDNLRLEGAVVPFVWQYHITKKQYEILEKTPRSYGGPGTITVEADPSQPLAEPEDLGPDFIPKPEV